MLATRKRALTLLIAVDKGFTLIEILTATVILALVMAGLANIFISGKRYVLHTRSRSTGGELGKYFLDELQMEVNQSNWTSTCLSNQTNCPNKTIGTQQGLDRNYTASYKVSPQFEGANLSKITVNITWNETE